MSETKEVELPLVTVIIANYNNGKWINTAIKSAAKQNYLAKQIVVVDDASTDNSVEVVEKLIDLNPEEYKKLDSASNINVVYGSGVFKGVPVLLVKLDKNRGPSFARNLAMKLTWGKTFAFAILDADDYWLQDRLLIMMETMMENPGVIGAVYTDYLNVNVKTHEIVHNYKMSASLTRLERDCVVHSGCLINKDMVSKVIENNRIYDEEMRTAEDWDLWLRLNEVCVIRHIPKVTLIARVHDHNATNSYSMEVWNNNWKRVALKARSRRK